MATTMERFTAGVEPGDPGRAGWGAPVSASEWQRGDPILVATDGTPASEAAVRVAAALSEAHGVEPHAIRVLDPLVYALGAEAGVALPIPEVEGSPARVRAELARAAADAARWPFRIEVGAPAPLIRREATRLDAALLVLGLRRHGMFERIARDETALQVMRGAPCPVLAVRASLETLPRRAVVGIDFSRASIRATRTALRLLAPGGTLILAHVDASSGPLSERAEGDGIVHALGMQAAFARITNELSRRPDVTVEVAVLEHAPGAAGVATELLSLATRADADLLAVGSHQHGRFDRWLLGSVTQGLIRDGRCSLLIVPPHEAPPPRAS